MGVESDTATEARRTRELRKYMILGTTLLRGKMTGLYAHSEEWVVNRLVKLSERMESDY